MGHARPAWGFPKEGIVLYLNTKEEPRARQSPGKWAGWLGTCKDWGCALATQLSLVQT